MTKGEYLLSLGIMVIRPDLGDEADEKFMETMRKVKESLLDKFNEDPEDDSIPF